MHNDEHNECVNRGWCNCFPDEVVKLCPKCHQIDYSCGCANADKNAYDQYYDRDDE